MIKASGMHRRRTQWARNVTVAVAVATVAMLPGVTVLSALLAPAAAAAPAGPGSFGSATATGRTSHPTAAGYGDAANITRQSEGAAAATTTQAAAVAASPGYWTVASDGGVYSFGGVFLGDLRGQHLNAAIVGMAATSDGKGYWLVASDGGIFNFGDAKFYGSEGGQHLNRPIVAMAATADGKGYWLVASDGGIFSFGDAKFYGSEGGHHLNRPILAMVATPDGKGYRFVASDGGIFNFGDAKFYGSEGGQHLNRPIVGMAATSNGGGYWLVASDGGIFAFGNAVFYGSEGSEPLNKPIVTMGATPSGGGYWMIASDGGVFTFGDAPYLGSTGADPGPAPVVALAVTDHAYDTGYDISWPQCSYAGASTTVPLPTATGLALVGATDGYIAPVANPCLNAEAAWAGPAMQTYLVATPISASNGSLSTATVGPKSCPMVADTTACGYNWGWTNTMQSIAMVHAHGLTPTRWWLDVELGEGWSGSDTAVSAQVIQGMVDALRSEGLIVGIYATNYQWGYITGGLKLPGIPTWIAGAGNLYTGTYSALAFCTESAYDFAGGIPYAVQFGYTGSGYSGPVSDFDQDYSCPR